MSNVHVREEAQLVKRDLPGAGDRRCLRWRQPTFVDSNAILGDRPANPGDDVVKLLTVVSDASDLRGLRSILETVHRRRTDVGERRCRARLHSRPVALMKVAQHRRHVRRRQSTREC